MGLITVYEKFVDHCLNFEDMLIKELKILY